MNKETELAEKIMEWWEEHKDDTKGDYGEYDIYEEKPEFVTMAEDILTLKKKENDMQLPEGFGIPGTKKTLTVKLTYFKPRGKYYSGGEYETEHKPLFQIWDEIVEMFRNHKRPGLCDGEQEFITLVNVPEHEHDHPHLIMP